MYSVTPVQYLPRCSIRVLHHPPRCLTVIQVIFRSVGHMIMKWYKNKGVVFFHYSGGWTNHHKTSNLSSCTYSETVFLLSYILMMVMDVCPVLTVRRAKTQRERLWLESSWVTWDYQQKFIIGIKYIWPVLCRFSSFFFYNPTSLS